MRAVRPASAAPASRRPPPDAPPGEQLVWLFRRNGYIRWQDEEQLKRGHRVYKKGHELRFVADDAEELELIQDLLRQVGLEPGRPFAKGRQFRQPVYGKRAVDSFLELLEKHPG